jgi:tRNA G18 (ribose-2'-O)-methylase SpoU
MIRSGIVAGMSKETLFVVLDNVRSAHNVGAIFRTADGAGVSRIFLVGVTPQPLDRFGRIMPEIAKTSLGATETVAWEYCADADACLARLHEEGVQIVAVEQDARAVPYTDALPLGGGAQAPTAYIFGNEVDGVSREFLDAAEMIVQIPMLGTKESLNVATTAGIILFQHRAHGYAQGTPAD